MTPSATRKGKRTGGGFSLVELLAVISIVAVIMALTVPNLIGMAKSGNFTGSLNEMSDCLQQARATAMAGNTYVWVGVLPVASNSAGNVNGTNQVLLAAVSAKNGQVSDFAAGNYIPLRKGRALKNVALQQFPSSVLQGSGRQTIGVDDISASSLSSGTASCQFVQTVGQQKINGATPVFKELIQFGPLGDARIKTTASRWIEIGMQSSPGKNPSVGIIQINGLTGQVRLFR